jgi:acid stress-induced BolA-like protein IbaG/YrbA
MSGHSVVAVTTDWPAWVQAIGSVTAIFAAIGLHVYADFQRVRRQRVVYASLMARVGDEARACIGAMERSYTERENLSVTAVELDQAIADLRAIGMSAELDDVRLELALDLMRTSRSLSAEVRVWSSISSRREPVSTSSLEKSRQWAEEIEGIERRLMVAAR